METKSFAVVAANGDSEILEMGGGDAYFVDLYVPFLAGVQTAPNFDSGDFTFQYSVDGTNYKDIPAMTVATNAIGYRGRFLVWGSKLRYTLANSSGATTAVAAVSYKKASMTQVRTAWAFLEGGVMNATSGVETFHLGRAPDMLLLDMEAGTWDSVSMVIQGSVDGANWVDLAGTRHTANDQYRVFTNPGGLTYFQLEWTGGGTSSVGMAIQVTGLTNKVQIGIKKDASLMATTALDTGKGVVVTVGSADVAGAKTLADQTATHSQTILNDSFATIGADYNLLVADLASTNVVVARLVDCLRANGMLPEIGS